MRLDKQQLTRLISAQLSLLTQIGGNLKDVKEVAQTIANDEQWWHLVAQMVDDVENHMRHVVPPKRPH
jgi:hypothetical protein